MAAAFQPQQLTVHSHKKFSTAGFLAAMLIIPMLAGCSLITDVFKPPTLAPLMNANSPNRIPGEYIVVFKSREGRSYFAPAAEQTILENVKRLGGTIMHRYSFAPIGFSARLPEAALQALRAEPNVDYIEVNQTGWFNTVQCRDQSQSCQCGSQPCLPAIEPPTGLDRISERGIVPLNNPLRLDGRYSYSENGARVHVYVIDSGIDDTHEEFSQRVEPGIKITSATTPTTPPSPLSDTRDCNTHGTHVAGIIGGNTVGVAKGVTLHPVRVNGNGCGDSTLDLVIKGVQWVKENAIPPAVVNLSVSFWIEPEAQRTALKDAVIASINSGITHVIAAGNHNIDACAVPPNTDYWESPALVNQDVRNRAIVVGAIDPSSDTRWDVGSLNGSNFGPCLSLFAPGVNIRSARSNQAQNPPRGGMDLSGTGTSQAAAHVTGVVARILGINGNSNLSPSEIWNRVHAANNVKDDPVAGTTILNGVEWAGVLPDPGTGSSNEMLHYGSRNNGYNDGDPHITTVNGIHYDFQSGGEFVALRGANGLEIQTRQTPIATAPSLSVNTAIAARVGQHRVTWQPNLSGQPDPSGLQLRVDGDLATIGVDGRNLDGGGRVALLDDGHTLNIDFPDGTTLIAASHWWGHRQQWHLDVHAFHTPATGGIMGDIERDSWLQPQFVEAWRVTDATSLFDYAPGDSTKTFTFPSSSLESIPPVKPENEALAKGECDGITNKNILQDCLFDVAVTGDPLFAKSARVLQKIQHGATHTKMTVKKQYSRVAEEAVLTATVTSHEQGGRTPSGAVMFMYDGKPMDCPVSLDAHGQAKLKTWFVMVRDHVITAKYMPDKESVFLPSSSRADKMAGDKEFLSNRGESPK